MKWLKRIFCTHEYRFVRNLYGDQINYWSTSELVRSVWRCKHCGKLQGRGELHDDGDLKRGWD